MSPRCRWSVLFGLALSCFLACPQQTRAQLGRARLTKVIGRIAARGTVLRQGAQPGRYDPAGDSVGEPTWVEYDQRGRLVRSVGQDASWYALSPDAHNALVTPWLDARQAYLDTHPGGTTEAVPPDVVSAEDCVDATGTVRKATAPSVDASTLWALVGRPGGSALPSCEGLVLATSRLEHPDIPSSDAGSLLLNSVGRIVQRAPVGHVFALESAFFTPSDDATSRCRVDLGATDVDLNLAAFMRCSPGQQAGGEGHFQVWAPIQGATADTVSGYSFVDAITSALGYYEIPFKDYPDSYESLAQVTARVMFGNFSPRSPSSKYFYLHSYARHLGSAGYFANFAVDAALLNVVIRMSTYDQAGQRIHWSIQTMSSSRTSAPASVTRRRRTERCATRVCSSRSARPICATRTSTSSAKPTAPWWAVVGA